MKLPYYIVKLKIRIGEYEKVGKHFVQATYKEYPEQSAIHQAILNESHEDILDHDSDDYHDVVRDNGFIQSRSDAEGGIHYSVSSIQRVTDTHQIRTLQLYL